MKGLDLARGYYETYGKPMLEKDFPDILSRIAIALFGEGSECYGYDDALSCDHDLEPGFMIFLPDEDTVSEKQAFALEKAYLRLPKEYLGYQRSLFSPADGNRHGVFRASAYFMDRLGSADGTLSLEQYFTLPEHLLYEALNGEIFSDPSGLLKDIRANLSVMPEDILKKKLVSCLLSMSQSAEYNYERCLRRKEYGAAQLTVNEYVRAAMKCIFLLNRTYMPYYKWQFRALRELKHLSLGAEILEYLLQSANSEEEAANKRRMMNLLSEMILEEAERQNILKKQENLQKTAFALNDSIRDADIRNMFVSTAV